MEQHKLFPNVEEARKSRIDFLVGQITDMRPAIEEQFKVAGRVKFTFHKTGRMGIDNRGYLNVICDGLYNAAEIVAGWAKDQGYEVEGGNGVYADIAFLYVSIPKQK
jgi:hypothetical protein